MSGEFTTRGKRYSAALLMIEMAAVAVLAALDQLTKYLVVRDMKYADIPVLGNLLHLYYQENTGAAFSIFEGKTWILAVVTFLMVAACIVILVRQRFSSGLIDVALVLISGGGIGNLIDRVFRGYVVDFIYFKAINFADFNMADSCVVVGALLLCLELILLEVKEKRQG